MNEQTPLPLSLSLSLSHVQAGLLNAYEDICGIVKLPPCVFIGGKVLHVDIPKDPIGTGPHAHGRSKQTRVLFSGEAQVAGWAVNTRSEHPGPSP